MSRPDPQAATAATLAALGAPTPWWPQTASGRVISDAQGRPRLLVLPVDDSDASTDADLARFVSRAMNERAGERQPEAGSPFDPDHLDALHEETQRVARQMGRRVGGSP